MLFGEKYGDRVRIITFDPGYSMELCGGTHAEATGEIGYLRLLHETSAAAGIRRIEAVVGLSADQQLRSEKELIQSIRAEIGQSEDPARDIHRLVEEKKNLEKEIERLRLQHHSARLDQLIHSARKVDGGISLVTGELPDADMDVLKQIGYESLDKRQEGTITVLGSRDDQEGKVYLVAAVTEDLIRDRGLQAGSLVAELGRRVGGGGGGQPNLATAGGRQPEKLREVLEQVESIVQQKLNGH